MAWRRCGKCGGQMGYNDSEWAWACLQCAKRVYQGGVLEAQPALEAPEGQHLGSRAPLPAVAQFPGGY